MAYRQDGVAQPDASQVPLAKLLELLKADPKMGNKSLAAKLKLKIGVKQVREARKKLDEAIETIQKYQRGRVARKLVSPELPLVEKIGNSYELGKYPQLLIQKVTNDLDHGISSVNFLPRELEGIQLHLAGCDEAAIQAFRGQLREKVHPPARLSAITRLPA